MRGGVGPIVEKPGSHSTDRVSPIGTWWHNQANLAIGPAMHLARDDLIKPDHFLVNPTTQLVFKTHTRLFMLKKAQKQHCFESTLKKNLSLNHFSSSHSTLLFIFMLVVMPPHLKLSRHPPQAHRTKLVAPLHQVYDLPAAVTPESHFW